jgi:nitrogen fixation protein NifU and related proteins
VAAAYRFAQVSTRCDNSLMFTQALLDHFKNPRNAGELADANVRVTVSNPVCGDILELAARIDAGVVCEIRFLCRGCTASIACASVLTEMIRGRELRGLEAITSESLAASLGGLPPASFHAATLAYDALQHLRRAAAS